MAKGNDPEDSLKTKLDMCITDGIVKTGTSVLIGTLASMFFMQQRRWPIIAGLGVGVGLACANCEYELLKKTKES